MIVVGVRKAREEIRALFPPRVEAQEDLTDSEPERLVKIGSKELILITMHAIRSIENREKDLRKRSGRDGSGSGLAERHRAGWGLASNENVVALFERQIPKR